ncbi:MAG: hypothetical protein NTZ83_03780, partial [Candidatus Pacearchaeota archaeon]|nr:hypothetical protein [Candidatus Pacearchaeota archaeon]
MKIPKIFGNRVVLIVIALALLLIVIISLINVGKMAFTGFSSLNNEKKQGAQNTETPSGNLENTDSEGTNNGGALSILVVERGNNFTDMSSNTSSNPPSNTLSS